MKRSTKWTNTRIQTGLRLIKQMNVLVKFKEGTELSKVALSSDSIERAYSLSGITPKGEKIKRLRQILQPLELG
jgi:hypothetical protein